MDQIDEQLGRWAGAHVPEADHVTDVAPMPGNSGLSFGFSVRSSTGDVIRRLVIRLAPPNVRRQGNTDVLRQVPLLQALEASGVPTAELIWSTSETRWFGTDAIVQELLPATHLPMVRSSEASDDSVGDAEPYLRQAVETLAQIHRVDWRERLDGWDTEKPLSDRIEFWGRLLAKHPSKEWRLLGEQLGQCLVRTDPGNHLTGLCHGDYQTHNILYDDQGDLTAVVDWEIAGIGPVGIDVGWLSIMTDPSCWHAERADLMVVTAAPAWLLSQYERATGSTLDNFTWYRALACYVYGAIAGFNLYLHRSGRRVDVAQELTGPATPVLFQTGIEHLASASPTSLPRTSRTSTAPRNRTIERT